MTSPNNRIIPEEYRPLVEQVLLHMTLAGLLPPTANAQCLELEEETASKFDAWLEARQ